MFHFTDSASIVWPLWYSAPRLSLNVHGRLGLHLVVEIDQPAGDAGERRRNEIDDVAMGIEPDRVLARTEAQRAAAFGMPRARAGRARQAAGERRAGERRRRRQKTTPCTFGTLVLRSVCHGRRLPEIMVVGRKLAM
jgi:hypothetical protein